MYHFCDQSSERILISDPNEVVDKIKELNEVKHFEKMVELFPEFDIIPDISFENKNLERCMEKIRNINTSTEEKKRSRSTKKLNLDKPLFDPHLSKIKKINAMRADKKIKYDDEPEKKSIRNFFKKK